MNLSVLENLEEIRVHCESISTGLCKAHAFADLSSTADFETVEKTSIFYSFTILAEMLGKLKDECDELEQCLVQKPPSDLPL